MSQTGISRSVLGNVSVCVLKLRAKPERRCYFRAVGNVFESV